MKRYQVLVLVVFTSMAGVLQAQVRTAFQPGSFMEPIRLEVSHNKTSHLVFPGPITSIDRGSQDILASRAEGVDYILRLKAAVKTFEETSLSVITSDGRLYTFLVCYNPSPAHLNVAVTFQEGQFRGSAVSVIPGRDKELALQTGIQNSELAKVLAAKDNFHKVTRRAKMHLALCGLFVENNKIFFRLLLKNTSAIHFPTGGLRFYLQDKKQSRRTASQQVELKMQSLWGNASCIPAQSADTLILTAPAFTIPAGKYLRIEVLENGGGRQLALRIRDLQLLRARPLPGEQPENK